MKVRRRFGSVVEISERRLPDLKSLLRGAAGLAVRVEATATCVVSGAQAEVSASEFSVLSRVSRSEWIDAEALCRAADVDMDLILSMVDKRLLLSDQAECKGLVEADAQLEARGWLPMAAAYHAATRWSGVLGDEAVRDHSPDAVRARMDQSMRQFGAPPPHLPEHPEATVRIALGEQRVSPALSALLGDRATRRAYRTDLTLPFGQFGAVLHAAFAAQGARTLAPHCVAMKRTSASGGGLHPIEPYVLVVNVEGLESGLYHYEWGRHALALLRPVDTETLRSCIERFVIGQSYFAEAHALVFHVARASRNTWKYRKHAKAYKVLFMDSGHLSQTLYLAAADLGLGAFFTGAVNDADFVQWAGLDPLDSIVIGANGFGIIDASRTELDMRPEPWEA